MEGILVVVRMGVVFECRGAVTSDVPSPVIGAWTPRAGTPAIYELRLEA
jgi:hypothetical protein